MSNDRPPRDTVLPHLISGQFIEHCKPSILQRTQPSSTLHFSRDIRARSLSILSRRLRPSSTPMGFEYIQWVSCIHLTKLPVTILVGHNTLRRAFIWPRLFQKFRSTGVHVERMLSGDKLRQMILFRHHIFHQLGVNGA